MHKIWSLILIGLVFPVLCLQAQDSSLMDNAKMLEILKEKADQVEGEPGLWTIGIADRVLFVITDEVNNRMRIFTPILEQKDLEEGFLEKMLEANFHSALDAKYGLYEGLVVSLFTHPLGQLTKPQFVDALYQVANLADTFGTTFSSTGLLFGGGQGEGEEEKRINQSPRKQSGS